MKKLLLFILSCIVVQGSMHAYGPVITAVINRDPQVVEDELKSGGNVNERGANRCTALHYAIEQEFYFTSTECFACLQIVKILLDQGADLDLRNNEGRTPLEEAIFLKNQEAEQLIREEIARRDAVKMARKEAVIKDEVERGATFLNAVIHRDVLSVKNEIACGANPNICGSDGNTALHCAVRHKSPEALEIVKILLAAGADVLLENAEGSTPLQDAIFYNNSAAGCLLEEITLREIVARRDNLINSVRSGDPLKVEAALNAGGQVNERDATGNTALHYAVYYKSPKGIEIVKMLIKAGANLDTLPNNLGRTALEEAVSCGNDEAVQLMQNEIERKKDIFLEKFAATETLVAFVISATPRAVAIKLRAGADVNEIGENGNTALHHAVKSMAENKKHFPQGDFYSPKDLYELNQRYLEIIKMLIEAGANLDLRNDEGRTPLEEAIINENHEAAQLIRKKLAHREIEALLGAMIPRAGAAPSVRVLSEDIHREVYELLKKE